MNKIYNFGLGPVTISDELLEMYTPDLMDKDFFYDEEGIRNNKVFVAATNMQGQHGGGSARFACDELELEWGLAEGLSKNGIAYALPTMDYSLSKPGMKFGNLKISEKQLLDAFINLKKCALDNPTLDFYLTKIGLGIAGWDLAVIHKLFWKSEIPFKVTNIIFPIEFEKLD